jgi:hypothetical protein
VNHLLGFVWKCATIPVGAVHRLQPFHHHIGLAARRLIHRIIIQGPNFAQPVCQWVPLAVVIGLGVPPAPLIPTAGPAGPAGVSAFSPNGFPGIGLGVTGGFESFSPGTILSDFPPPPDSPGRTPEIVEIPPMLTLPASVLAETMPPQVSKVSEPSPVLLLPVAMLALFQIRRRRTRGRELFIAGLAELFDWSAKPHAPEEATSSRYRHWCL